MQPAAARGRGIRVLRKWNELPKRRNVLVQSYMQNPYLIDGLKFDLRVYVYLSSVEPLRVYVYRDGLVRFASSRFSLKESSLRNKFAHLTNYAINCSNPEYRSNKDEAADGCEGHKWSLRGFWSYMREQGHNMDAVWARIKTLAVKTILRCASIAHPLTLS